MYPSPRYGDAELTAIAVIAGAGPGLGYSLAKKFSSEYKVVLLSRTQEKLDALANEIKKEGGDVYSSLCRVNTGPWNCDRLE